MPVPASIAVIGSSSILGRAILDRLARTDLDVLAVDVDGPDMPPGQVRVKLMDARDRLLPLAIHGVDTIIHAAFPDDASGKPDAQYGITVGGTRNVLDAASKAGVSRLVVLSSTAAYGAHSDNPVPLPESAPLRANPALAYAHHRLLAEEMVAEWSSAHPGVSVTVLRVGPVLAPGVDTELSRLLTSPRIPAPAGGSGLWQLAHPDDVADAVALVLDKDVRGTFNVASDGWLTTQEVASAMGRHVIEVGQTTLEETLRRAHRLGLSPMPAERLPFLLHPVVVDVSALREQGWRPSHNNRDILALFGEHMAGRISLGRFDVTRQQLARSARMAGGAMLLLVWQLRRRRRARRGDGA